MPRGRAQTFAVSRIRVRVAHLRIEKECNGLQSQQINGHDCATFRCIIESKKKATRCKTEHVLAQSFGYFPELGFHFLNSAFQNVCRALKRAVMRLRKTKKRVAHLAAICVLTSSRLAGILSAFRDSTSLRSFSCREGKSSLIHTSDPPASRPLANQRNETCGLSKVGGNKIAVARTANRGFVFTKAFFPKYLDLQRPGSEVNLLGST